MRQPKIQNAFLKIGLALLLAGLVLPATWCSARDSSIKMPAYYPETFSRQGCIDRIEAEKVVINDRLYKFSPDVSFHTLKAEDTDRSWFKPGCKVGLIVNSGHEIISLWGFKKGCK